MRVAINEQRAFADEEFGADDWGIFISGYAPVFDSNGDFVCIVGIDLTADDYATRLSDFERAGLLALTISVLTSILVGLLAMLYQARSNQARRLQEEARVELESLAASLDSANQNLRQASWRFEQLFNVLPVACFTFDAEGVVYEWSKECKRQIGLEAYEVVQRSMFDTFVSKENRGQFKNIIETVMSGDQVVDFEWTDSDKTGREFTSVINVFPIKRHDSQITGGIAACLDITERQRSQLLFEQKVAELQDAYGELEETRLSLELINSALTDANERLEKMATSDSLTGLLNHGKIVGELDNAIALAKRHDRPLSIVMLDVDNFKKLNDTEGHVAGDAVLVSLAKTLQEVSRIEDRVGRYGGEEFLIVLPETSADQALELAKRFRTAVQVHTKRDGSVTASFGVATLDGSNLTPAELIELADKAMYKAKKDGKNRVVHDLDRFAA